jgi:heat shock protein HslJ
VKPSDLDDPTPIEPDAETLARVHARSRGFRRRRRVQRWVGVGCGALVVVLAIVVAIAVPIGDERDGPSRPSGATTTTRPPVTVGDLRGEWRPVSITGYEGPIARLSGRARLAFAEGGKLSGSDGCNAFTGSYQLGSDASFETAEYRQTLIGCDDQLPLQQTLAVAARVDVSDRRLVLLASDGSELAEFVRPVVTARIELPSDTIVAGMTTQGSVVVQNDTGEALHASGCGHYFQVLLENDDVRQEPGWRLCLEQFTFPVGESRHPITVSARYNNCVGGAGLEGFPTCVPGGGPPPLPVGDYRATLFQSGNVVPAPPPIPFHVVARAPTTDFSAAAVAQVGAR